MPTLKGRKIQIAQINRLFQFESPLTRQDHHRAMGLDHLVNHKGAACPSTHPVYDLSASICRIVGGHWS
jgi:hypothetical protein